MRLRLSQEYVLIDSDADFRTIDQRKWFDSAMELLNTQYRTSVVAGLVLSIGSSIDSLVRTIV